MNKEHTATSPQLFNCSTECGYILSTSYMYTLLLPPLYVAFVNCNTNCVCSNFIFMSFVINYVSVFSSSSLEAPAGRRPVRGDEFVAGHSRPWSWCFFDARLRPWPLFLVGMQQQLNIRHGHYTSSGQLDTNWETDRNRDAEKGEKRQIVSVVGIVC